MNDKWLTDIKDKMSGFEQESEPAGLWEAISSSETFVKPAATPRRTAGDYRWWLWGAAAAAVVLALILFPGHPAERQDLLAEEQEGIVSEARESHSEVQGLLSEVQGLLSEVPSASESGFSYLADASAVSGRAQPSSGTEPASAPASSSGPVPSEPTPNPSVSTPEQSSSTPEPAFSGQEQFSSGKNPTKASAPASARRALALAVYSSGAAGSSGELGLTGNQATAALGPDNAVWEDSPILGMLAFNQGRSLKRSTHHHQPVRAGFSVSVDLCKRLSLETGLGYSHLYSEFREGSEEYYVNSTQTLGYLSVPLNLRYRLFPRAEAAKKNGVEVYALAGVAAAKCVYATGTRSVVLDGKSSPVEPDVFSQRPFQFSVGAGLGVQYLFNRSLGIFFEPGISYYFDDSGDFDTIYKERPLNLSLNLGLRLNL